MIFTDDQAKTILAVLGTRPEAIKMAPVLRELRSRPHQFRPVTVVTSQHTDILHPLIDYFDIEPDYRLDDVQRQQSLNGLLGRIIATLDPILEEVAPDLVLIQGDTTTTLAGALSAYNRRIPVAHVEAGLRSGNPFSPFPEETNRRLATSLATYHLAATAHNVRTLRREGVSPACIALTGNPVVDAMRTVLTSTRPSPRLVALLEALSERRIIVLTSHRRENMGDVMRGNFGVLQDFVDRHPETALVFPVHPNPDVRAACAGTLHEGPRVKLIGPLLYPDFLHLLAHAWLIVSDSGGVQEEAPTLGKPLLILRENTERPESVSCGIARLVGKSPRRLYSALEDIARDDHWLRTVKQIENPFGRGDSAMRICTALVKFLDSDHASGKSAA